MICGVKGSGKSSLLSAILGNMKKTSGFMFIDEKTKICYTPQNSWIQNCSLRNNITFGNEFDEEKFNKVIRCSQLLPDINRFPSGVNIEIGEKGINLSGGQKARISLGRACYSDTNLVLLDDPLSAVDVDVANKIMEECILDYMRDRTRILVTHQVQFLNHADYVIVMEEGKIIESGTFEELFSAKGKMFELVSKTEKEDFSYEKKKDVEEINYMQEISKDEDDSSSESESKEKKIIDDEIRFKGYIPPRVILSYICGMGCYGIPFLLVVSLFIFPQVAITCGDWWLASWTASKYNERYGNSYEVQYFYNSSTNIYGEYIPSNHNSTCPTNMSGISHFVCLLIYGLLGLIALFLGLAKAMIASLFALRSSTKIHGEALKKILFSPISFYDSTPIERIMNRFSEDLFVMDSDLVFAIRITGTVGFMIIGAIFLIVLSTNGLGLVILLPLGICYFVAYILYRKGNLELKRLENLSKAPMMAFFYSSQEF